VHHIDRAGGAVEPAAGWETFTRLRVLILAGAAALLATAIVAQTRPVFVARTLIGVVLGLLILRRIAFSPDIAGPVTAQAGVLVGLAGALAAVLGGMVDSGREIVERYPAMAFWRQPAGELGRESRPRASARPAGPARRAAAG
jgi:hypothetical protein